MYKVTFVYRSVMDDFSSSHRYECTRNSLTDAIEFISIIANRMTIDHELLYTNIQYIDEEHEEMYFDEL